MRITSLALALFLPISFGIMGCDRSEVDPVVTEDTEPTDDVVIVDPDVPADTPSDEPVDESPSAGLQMPADEDLEPAVSDPPTTPPEPLTIGSQAPPLDIEHWVSDGNGKYEPVSEFEEGNVYIVEFWATWCGPCIASMPHLAELQQDYADQGVRLISVSDEPLETVEQFLDREVQSSAQSAEDEDGEEEETQTYRELTSVYSLTTDPDRSTHAAYMEAANQTGIPTAFIVGKTGEVEWIGHPMTMDEPLEAIVKGEWDRAEFAQQMELQSKVAEAQTMMRQGQMEEGLALVNQLLEEIEDPELLLGLKFFKLQALIAMQDESDEVPALASDLMDEAAERPEVVPQLTWIIYQATRSNDVPKDLLEKTIAAAEEAVEELDPDQRPSMLDTLAHLHEANEDLDAAIAAQQEAVNLSEGRTQERLQQYLDQLKAKKEAGEEADEAKPEDADDATPDEADDSEADEAEADEAEAGDSEAGDGADSEAPAVVEEVTDSESLEEAADGDDGADEEE